MPSILKTTNKKIQRKNKETNTMLDSLHLFSENARDPYQG